MTERLLTDPFLQRPTPDSVRVVWFTEFPGDRHFVRYGKDLERQAIATTSKLSRLREDKDSRVGGQTKDNPAFETPTERNIWRHEAIVAGLDAGNRLPYTVTSITHDGTAIESDRFSLSPEPPPGRSLKILLTSDHQLKPMVAANLQKVVETVGRVDAVFLAGDLVNIPDRASEWFDDERGGAFFPALQGRASYELESSSDGASAPQTTVYSGGEIIQHAPLFPAVGNHEVMGRYSDRRPLNAQFDDAVPRAVAEQAYLESEKALNPSGDPQVREALLKRDSFNIDTYREIFSLPEPEKYYATSFGDVRLVVLFATNIWRPADLGDNVRGRYQEAKGDLANPERWGRGQHIFEAIARGSEQYRWLEAELNSDAFARARYKIVMLHHPPHTLGDNIVPPYTDPVPVVSRNDAREIVAVRYDYPKEKDYLIRDVMPLLEAAGVDLVFYGHSHLWNRFEKDGIHFLESSNVGNSYGAATADNPRPVPRAGDANYVAVGDPNGLTAVTPTIAPLRDEAGALQPYIASNDITAFSILDTGAGTVSSYSFDTRQPDSAVVKFDEFTLASAPQPLDDGRILTLVLGCTAAVALVLLVTGWWRDRDGKVAG